MKYMLMMNAPRAKTGNYPINNWSPEDFKAHIDFMQWPEDLIGLAFAVLGRVFEVFHQRHIGRVLRSS